MNTRVFKNIEFESQDLTAYTADEITKKYNIYGFFLQDEYFSENLQEYREERNESFQVWKEKNTSYTLSQVKDFLEKFIEEYEYYPEGYTSLYGRPTKLFIFENQDDYYKSFDEIEGEFFYEDGSVVEESNLNDYIESHEFWDGSNWQEIILTNEYGHCYFEEITDEYPNWDKMELIDHTPEQTGEKNLFLHEDDFGKKYILENISYYQSVGTSYEELSYEQLQKYLLLNKDAREKIEGAESLIQDYFNGELEKGEKIFLDGNEVVFRFKGDDYHFTNEELYGEVDEFYYQPVIKVARKALKERRKDRYTEILQERSVY